MKSLKNHFTSLISTISFTLYALLPTIQPYLFGAYPVESTSQALQGSSSSNASSSQASVEATPENSMLLQGHTESGPSESERSETETSPTRRVSGAVGESWASEFRRRDIESEPSVLGTTMPPGTETDDAVSG